MGHKGASEVGNDLAQDLSGLDVGMGTWWGNQATVSGWTTLLVLQLMQV